MSTKFSRKTFLKGSVAGLGMMALNVCTAGAASAAEPAAAARKLRREILSFILFPPGVYRHILPHITLFYIIPPFLA